MIKIEHKRSSPKNLLIKYPDSIIADVTSKAKDDLIHLSPFYPHGNIPIPYSDGITAKSVEGIWQGLKVFEKHGIDISSFRNDKMKNIKRTVRKYGIPLGHQKGVNSQELLDYVQARILIYLPSFLWILEKNEKVHRIINKLKDASKKQDIILLDYTKNGNVLDTSKPLSHAHLIKLYVEDKYPNQTDLLIQYEEMKQKSMNLFSEVPIQKKAKTINLNSNDLDLVEKIIEFVGNSQKSIKEIKNSLKIDKHHTQIRSIMKKSNRFKVNKNIKPHQYTKKYL